MTDPLPSSPLQGEGKLRAFSLVEPNRFSYPSAARLENHSPRLRSTPGSGAFSLVELSIVLVILGLLVGGVLSGQSLIRAAELRSISSEYSRYFTFQALRF